MNKSELEKLSLSDLKNLAKKMDLKTTMKKAQLIENIYSCFKEYEKYEQTINSSTLLPTFEKYEIHSQLGEEGKEGTTYFVTSKNSKKEYAMKTFRKKKSSSTLRKEASLQNKAAAEHISPKIVDIDTVSKFIVMEKMDYHLIDKMKKQNGNLTKNQQEQIIQIFKTLDKIKVFHGDSNILNYMYKNKKIYIIDFGMAKEINSSLIKKLGTEQPNLQIMTLGFILKLKELKCPETSYKYMLKYISNSEKERFNL